MRKKGKCGLLDLDLDLEIEKSLDKVRSSSELRTRYRNQVLDPDQGLSLDLDIYT